MSRLMAALTGAYTYIGIGLGKNKISNGEKQNEEMTQRNGK
jgi:hypothetical protein